MGAKAQLRRDLIQAQQQRDYALAEKDRAYARLNEWKQAAGHHHEHKPGCICPAVPLRPTKPSLVEQARDRVRGLLDDLTNALGVGW